MIEIQGDGFGCYKQNGGVLTLSGYTRIKEGGEGLFWSRTSSVSQVEGMAARCQISLTEEQIDLYAVLREIDDDEVQIGDEGKSVRGLSDQEVLMEVLLLTDDKDDAEEVKRFYKNIFDKSN